MWALKMDVDMFLSSSMNFCCISGLLHWLLLHMGSGLMELAFGCVHKLILTAFLTCLDVEGMKNTKILFI